MAKRKKKEVIEAETENKEQSKSHEGQLKWVVFGMIVLLLVIILAYFIVQESKYFNYGGLRYEKINSKSIPLYHTLIPMKNAAGNVIANFNLYLRNDPRELRSIAINDTLRLKTNTIISLDKDSEVGCEDAGIAGANFFGFLKSAGIKVSVAYSEENYAKEKNASYVTCETETSHSVIMIKKGEENRIIQEKQDCYVLEFKDCDILKTTERFMVALYADSKSVKV